MSSDRRVQHLLDAREVTVRFGGLTAVDHVDAVFMPGELVGSLGGVGAGAALSCSPAGDLLATAGPISQTYVRM